MVNLITPKHLLLTVIYLFMGLNAWAYDFDDGKIYFNITDAEKKTVEVTHSSIGYSGSIVIPETVENGGITYSVASIGDHAFRSCSRLTSITIPNSVTSIGEHAFYSCVGLSSVTIPSSVTSIGDYAFTLCSSLVTVHISVNVGSIGLEAFSYCDVLTSVDISAGVTSIGDGAFFICPNLSSINVDVSNEYFASVDGVLYDKNQTTLIQFPAGKDVDHFSIPASVTSIGLEAFHSCTGLASVDIPAGVVSIGSFAFSDCTGLIIVDLPNSVTSIGDYAFFYCSGLTSVTIPNSVTTIDEYAFLACSGLSDIYVQAHIPPACSFGAFWEIYSTAVLHVPVGTKADYETAYVWKTFVNIVEDVTTGIDGVVLDKLNVYILNNTLIVEGVEHPQVTVYGLSGMVVLQLNGNDVDVSTLPSGVYIVDVNGVQTKIVKR